MLWVGNLVMGLNNLIVNQQAEINAVVLHWPPSLRLEEDQFFDFCQANRELRIERTAEGDCQIMAPTGGKTSTRNSRIVTLISIWAEADGTGVVFDSSGGFTLPNGAVRSPDASWVNKFRLAMLTEEQKTRFLPLCPDFVIELRSPSDNIKALQEKMLEYIANGASLGWLIDPETKRVSVFQPDKPVSNLENPELLSADEVVKGFKLELQKIWNVGF
jgi:Uma2 family endonuclease